MRKTCTSNHIWNGEARTAHFFRSGARSRQPEQPFRQRHWKSGKFHRAPVLRRTQSVRRKSWFEQLCGYFHFWNILERRHGRLKQTVIVWVIALLCHVLWSDIQSRPLHISLSCRSKWEKIKDSAHPPTHTHSDTHTHVIAHTHTHYRTHTHMFSHTHLNNSSIYIYLNDFIWIYLQILKT